MSKLLFSFGMAAALACTACDDEDGDLLAVDGGAISDGGDAGSDAGGPGPRSDGGGVGDSGLGMVDVHFDCPAARDDDEPGASYALYAAPLLPGDDLPDVTCTP